MGESIIMRVKSKQKKPGIPEEDIPAVPGTYCCCCCFCCPAAQLARAPHNDRTAAAVAAVMGTPDKPPPATTTITTAAKELGCSCQAELQELQPGTKNKESVIAGRQNQFKKLTMSGGTGNDKIKWRY